MKTYRFSVRVDGIIEVEAQNESEAWENIPSIFSSYFGDFEALSIVTEGNPEVISYNDSPETDSDS